MKILITQAWFVMRLATLILLAGTLHLSATSYSQTVTYEARETSILEVLRAIEQQTGFVAFTSTELLKKGTPVSVQFHDTPIEAALKALFNDQPLAYEIKDKNILIREKALPSALPTVISTARSDEKPLILAYPEVRGRVVDSLGNPLPGASIRVLNAVGQRTTLQTQTDRSGKFLLRDVPEGATLEISYIGYIGLQISVQPDIGDIVLKILPTTIREVEINAGYYTVTDRERTGSISRVTTKEIESQPVLNPLASMIGRMPGVSVTQFSGVPGGGFKVEVRGRNSLSTEVSNPLYIIDGVPFSGEGLGSNQVSTIYPGSYQHLRLNPFSSINPSDIESIEVLKDADATAIYGSRGANGVVLITTKQGKSGETAYNFRYHHGFGKVTRTLDLLNTEEYLEMRREAYANDGVTDYPFNAYDINGTWDQNRYTDWQKELIGGTATQNNFQGSVSGGSQNTSFLLSGGYTKETTVFPGDYDNQKIGTHSTINHQSSDGRFSANLSVNYGADKNNLPGQDLSRTAMQLSPNAPNLYNGDGSLNWAGGTWDNPLRELEQSYQSKINNLNSNVVLAYEILPRLKIKTSLGFNDMRMNESRTQPNTYYNPSFGFGPELSMIFLSSTTRQSWIVEPQISYQYSIVEVGEIQALIGATFQESQSDFLEQFADNFSSNSLIYDIAAASNHYILNNSEMKYRYNAFFGRINFNLERKYILNLTGRRDGSSRFGPEKQFANFGAIGGAWILSEEALVKENIKFLSFGKLRGSYGITGSDNIGDYKYLDTYSSSGVNYQGIIGLEPNGLFNPDFAWESNRKIEAALELGFLNNRLKTSVSYYNNRSSNQLVGIPLSAVTGFPSIQANLDATVQNTGWEFELNSTNIQQRQFHWTTSLNLTVPRNKLLSFPGLEGSTYANQYVVGEPLNIRKLYHYQGVDQETGIYQYTNVNSDGQLTIDDRTSIGRLNQDFFGGLNNSVSFGSFQLDIFFQFVKQAGTNYLYTFGRPGVMINQSKEVMRRWQQSGDITDIQRFSATNQEASSAYSHLGNSDAAYGDASFIRLKNLAVGYNLPLIFHKKAKGRVFFQGQNLFTITNYRGVDPEYGIVSVLPPLRMVTVGFELTF